MSKYSHPEATVNWDLRLEDGSDEKGRSAEGVVSAELPKIVFGKNMVPLAITPLKIYFSSAEAALAVARAKENHLRILVAEQDFNWDDGNTFIIARQHIFTIEQLSARFSPGIIKLGEPAYALCEFKVRKYAIMRDGQETFCVYTQDGSLHIK